MGEVPSGCVAHIKAFLRQRARCAASRGRSVQRPRNSRIIRDVRALDGHRRTAAVALIAVLILGLGISLALTSLSSTANIVQVASVIGLATPLIVWARADTKPPANTPNPDQGPDSPRPESVEPPEPVRRPRESSVLRKGLPPSKGATFRAPFPWAKWLTFLILVAWLISAPVCFTLGFGVYASRQTWYAIAGAFLFVPAFAVSLVVIILFRRSEEVINIIMIKPLRWVIKGIFTRRPRLIINKEGIRLRLATRARILPSVDRDLPDCGRR
jgi:hypothetical protein